MPELPDIVVYIESLETRIGGQALEGIHLLSPFVLRSVEPPLQDAIGRPVVGLRRLGKRIVIHLDPDLFLVFHLMIAGRFHWKRRDSRPGRKVGLACLDFPDGSLHFTEAGTKKRASLHLVRGERGLEEHDPGGLEWLASDLKTFRSALARERHTLKRSLTTPRLFSGIGNAYSDEILHRAHLSPFKMSDRLTEEESTRLFEAGRDVLHLWIERLREQARGRFPARVTAFRPDMAVHGRFRQPCPECASPIQRIVYAGNESNCCARCQTGEKLLADRALSRLLKGDWPRTLEELEERRENGRKDA
jgi:formamidopyrimidine-DNA glycosylase